MANAIQIPEGGWFPIAMGLVSFSVLTTWRRGRRLVSEEMAKQSIPMEDFLMAIDDVHRINGTAVFMRSEEHTSELQSHHELVCRLVLEKKKKKKRKQEKIKKTEERADGKKEKKNE